MILIGQWVAFWTKRQRKKEVYKKALAKNEIWRVRALHENLGIFNYYIPCVFLSKLNAHFAIGNWLYFRHLHFCWKLVPPELLNGKNKTALHLALPTTPRNPFALPHAFLIPKNRHAVKRTSCPFLFCLHSVPRFVMDGNIFTPSYAAFRVVISSYLIHFLAEKVSLISYLFLFTKSKIIAFMLGQEKQP